MRNRLSLLIMHSPILFGQCSSVYAFIGVSGRLQSPACCIRKLYVKVVVAVAVLYGKVVVVLLYCVRYVQVVVVLKVKVKMQDKEHGCYTYVLVQCTVQAFTIHLLPSRANSLLGKIWLIFLYTWLDKKSFGSVILAKTTQYSAKSKVMHSVYCNAYKYCMFYFLSPNLF